MSWVGQAGTSSGAASTGPPPDEIDGGHLPALSRPQELASRLLAYLGEVERAPQ